MPVLTCPRGVSPVSFSYFLQASFCLSTITRRSHPTHSASPKLVSRDLDSLRTKQVSRSHSFGNEEELAASGGQSNQQQQQQQSPYLPGQSPQLPGQPLRSPLNGFDAADGSGSGGSMAFPASTAGGKPAAQVPAVKMPSTRIVAARAAARRDIAVPRPSTELVVRVRRPAGVVVVRLLLFCSWLFVGFGCFLLFVAGVAV